MRQAIEQRGRHFGVEEDRRPFAEAEVCRDDDACALVEFAQEMEEQCAAGGAERQVAEFIEDHEIEAGEAFGDLTGFTFCLFLFERVDELDGREEADLSPVMLDGLDAKGRRDMGFSCSRRTNLILLDIMAVRRSFTTPFTRAAARRWPLCAATGSGRAGCWSSFSSTGRWRRYPPGCVSRMRHRCLSRIGLGSA